MPLLQSFGGMSARGYGFGVGRIPKGQAAYTTPGSYSFIVPAGVTKISIVAIGGGGSGGGGDASYYGAGGGGGALGYVNQVPVTPGETLSVYVGAGGYLNDHVNTDGFSGIVSYVNRGTKSLLYVENGYQGNYSTAGLGGTLRYTSIQGIGYAYDAVNGYCPVPGGKGGDGGFGYWSGGGGGAGGYSFGGGDGGLGSSYQNVPGNPSVGGGGAGGASGVNWGGSGGGVGILGEGSSGTYSSAGGSGGSNGTMQEPSGATTGQLTQGGSYGGGGGGIYSIGISGPWPTSRGGNGAVRIIWGLGRAYPSTNTGNV